MRITWGLAFLIIWALGAIGHLGYWTIKQDAAAFKPGARLIADLISSVAWPFWYMPVMWRYIRWVIIPLLSR